MAQNPPDTVVLGLADNCVWHLCRQHGEYNPILPINDFLIRTGRHYVPGELVIHIEHTRFELLRNYPFLFPTGSDGRAASPSI